MRELKLYQCEVCGTQYNTASQAEQCENFHRKPKKVKPLKYHPCTMTKSPYPLKVTVVFDDGTEAVYER